MDARALVDGHFSHTIDIRDRGLAYGDGVFETVRVLNRRAVFLERHLQRLFTGCQRLSIVLDLALVRSEIETLLSTCDDSQCILKIIITRGGVARGYRPENLASSHRIISLVRNEADYTPQQSSGVEVRVCDMRLSINPLLAGIKHLSRLENVIARAEWQQLAIAEGLMLDTDGRLIEGTMSNVFLVVGGHLVTPSLHRCGVEGVVRNFIVEKLKPDCELRDCTLQDVYRADEVFVCNSLIGIWPVVAISCHRKSLGPLTLSLQQALMAEELGDD